MQSLHAALVGPNAQIRPPPDEVVTAAVVEDADVVLPLVADTAVAETAVPETLVAETLVAEMAVPETLVAETPTVVGAPPDPPSSSSRTRTREPHAAAKAAPSARAIAFFSIDGC